MQLTEIQKNALIHSYEQQYITDFYRLVYISRTRKTMDSLEKRGLVRWFPYGNKGEGCWKITKKGKEYYSSL